MALVFSGKCAGLVAGAHTHTLPRSLLRVELGAHMGAAGAAPRYGCRRGQLLHPGGSVLHLTQPKTVAHVPAPAKPREQGGPQNGCRHAGRRAATSGRTRELIKAAKHLVPLLQWG